MSRPNLLIVTSHDLGRHLHSYGIDAVHSPNLDRFGSEGVRFANAFCTAPQCSPSRASLFTGRWPHSNGVMGLTHAHFAWDLYRDEKHLAQLLRAAGWRTAALGIIHETRAPERMGFDYILREGVGDAHPLTRAAIDYLKQRPKDQPFYLQVGYEEVHRSMYGYNAAPDFERGVYVPPYLVDDFAARQDFAHFQGAVRKLDAAFGDLLAALDAEGIAGDTLVIFAADHGIPFPRAKCSLYDPGLEIALLMRWPSGGWQAGQVVAPMVSNIDVAPTLLEVLDLPGPANLQGQSFAPLLKGDPARPREAIFGEMTYHDYCDPRRCIRTETHKLIVNFTAAPFFMDPSQQWRPSTVTRQPENPRFAYHAPVELYDLRDDPLETVNLASAPAHAAIRADLLHRLYAWMQATSDPLLSGIPHSPMHEWAIQALKTGALAVEQ